MNIKHRYKLFVLLGLTSMSAFSFAAPTEESCIAWMLYKEARGESIKVQRAVLDTLKNRMLLSNRYACEELHKEGAYPYFKYGVKKVNSEWMKHYKEVDKLPRVLDNSFIYFNNTRHSFGRDCKKLGKLWFCK